MGTVTAHPMGARLRRAREKAGLSQRAFATKMQMHFTHICKIEKGKMALSTERIPKAARILGTTAAYLAFGEGSA